MSENKDKLTRRERQRMLDEVYVQREEILKAFVAKHGLEPDKCKQVVEPDGTFYVVKLGEERVAHVRDNLIRARLHREIHALSWWQRLCFKMAGWQ